MSKIHLIFQPVDSEKKSAKAEHKCENIRRLELLKTLVRNSFSAMAVVNLSALSDEQIGD